MENKLILLESKLSQAFDWLEELEEEDNSRSVNKFCLPSKNTIVEQSLSERH